MNYVREVVLGVAELAAMILLTILITGMAATWIGAVGWQ